MTDNEFIKALEKALEVEVVHGIEARGYYLSSKILKATIDIFYRQKATIEYLETKQMTFAKGFYKQGIKDLAKRLKSDCQYTTDKIGKLQKVFYIDDLDNLLKEMVGDSE